jgi:hypothetical protein
MDRDRITRTGARAPGVERQMLLERKRSSALRPRHRTGQRHKSGEHEGRRQTDRRADASNGKALSEMPALKPYWGKPAVRNFRGSDGNVGIIRSPLRAIALPDQSCANQYRQCSPEVFIFSDRCSLDPPTIQRLNSRDHEYSSWLNKSYQWILAS